MKLIDSIKGMSVEELAEMLVIDTYEKFINGYDERHDDYIYVVNECYKHPFNDHCFYDKDECVEDCIDALGSEVY